MLVKYVIRNNNHSIRAKIKQHHRTLNFVSKPDLKAGKQLQYFNLLLLYLTNAFSTNGLQSHQLTNLANILSP